MEGCPDVSEVKEQVTTQPGGVDRRLRPAMAYEDLLHLYLRTIPDSYTRVGASHESLRQP